MLKMVDGTGIIGVDMICPLGVSTPQPPNYDRVEMEGTGMLVLPNSLDAPLERLELGGKTEQVQTTGKNVWDPNAYADFGLNENSANSIRFENDVVTYISDKGSYNQIALRIPIGKLQIGDYKVSFGRVTCKRKDTSKTESGTLGTFVFYKDGVLVTRSVTFSVDDPNADYSMTCSGFSAGNNGLLELSVENPMISQISVGTYEPYTGGKPSPSPEYPQEIKNSGKWNKETQKYEVGVKITGKNLLDTYEKAEKDSKFYSVNDDGSLSQLKPDVRPYSDVPSTLFLKSGVYYFSLFNTGVTFKCYNAEADEVFAEIKEPKSILVNLRKDANIKYKVFSNGGSSKNVRVMVSKTKASEYEPYTEQTLTLTSDRPITKWDKLVEQGGEIGWLYGSVIATIDETASISLYAPNGFYIYVKNIDKKEKTGYCDKLYTKKMSNGEPFVLFGLANNNFLYTLNTQEFYGKTASEIKAKLKEYPLNIIGKSETTEFVPLPQSEQNAIRALKTYYPTTVITADGGELDPDIKVTYRKEI